MNFEHTPHFETFSKGINRVRNLSGDEFHNALYFSNVISLMEQYLSSLFLDEIQSSPQALNRLANQKKFRSATVTVPYALNHSIENYLIRSMKSLVWHRINDVGMFYKDVFDIKFNISIDLLNQLDIRHDLVHRNGFTLDEEKVIINRDDLTHCIRLVEAFVADIERKYMATVMH